MNLQFQWDELEAFVMQSEGLVFNWCEPFF
jgi:hypothetical protein